VEGSNRPRAWVILRTGYAEGGGPDDEVVDPNEPTDPEIATATISAWLAAFFASPAAHRTNAQAGYTIAAAVAAAIVGAGLLTSIDDARWWVQLLWLVSLALWLYAAWSFMRTVAYQPNLGGVVHARTQAKLARDAIQRTWKERAAVARRSWKAQQAARLAGVMTFIAIVLGLVANPAGEETMSVALTKAGFDSVKPLCREFSGHASPVPFDARVDPSGLDDGVVVLKHVPCNGKSRTLLVPKAGVAGASAN
jgi:MFS family permease